MANISVEVDPNRDHISGSDDAPLTIVEYGDFECPHCGAAQPILESIRAKMGDRLRFVFRHFPLTQIHKHAQRAAEASESANAQGKFWEMHAALFAHQRALGDSHLREIAAEVGLDPIQFEADIWGDQAYYQRVRDDFMSGVRSGVNGTPTFFINGIRHDDSWDEDTLTEALEAAAK